MCTVNSKNKEVMCYQTCVQLYFNTRSSFTALGMQCHRHTSLLSKGHFTNTLQSTIPLWGGFFYLTTGHFSFVNFCCTITLTCFNILQHYLNVNIFFWQKCFHSKSSDKAPDQDTQQPGKSSLAWFSVPSLFVKSQAKVWHNPQGLWIIEMGSGRKWFSHPPEFLP